MSKSGPMDNIIRPASGSDKAKNNKKIVRVDDNGKVVSFPLGRRYCVITETTVEIAGCVANVRDFQTDERASINYRFLVEIEDNGYEKTARSLCSLAQKPVEILQKRILNILQDWNTTNRAGTAGTVPERFSVRSADIQSTVAEELKKIGLKVDLILEVKAPSSYRFHTGDVMVRMQDFTKLAKPINLELEIRPNKTLTGKKPAPIGVDEWRDLSRRFLSNIAAHFLSLHDYYFNAYKVREMFEKELNKALAEYRHFAKVLSLKALPPTFKRTVQVEFPVKWVSLSRREIAFRVKADLDLNDGGSAAYELEDLPDLRDWLHKRMKAEIERTLFDKDWVDLTDKQINDLQAEVESKVKKDATAIGYSIRTLLNEPRLPERSYLNHFELEVGKTDPFVTRDPSFKAEISCAVSGRLTSIKRVAHLLSNKDILKTEMAKVTEAVIREHMRDISPNDYILWWDKARSVDPDTNEARRDRRKNQAYVSDILVREIEARLTRQFDFDSQYSAKKINLLQNDRAIIEARDKVGKTPPLILMVETRPSDAPLALTFEVEILLHMPMAARITQILQKGVETHVIVRQLTNFIAEELSKKSEEELLDRTGELKEKLYRDLRKKTLHFAASSVGYAIEIITIIRKWTGEENVSGLERDAETRLKKYRIETNITKNEEELKRIKEAEIAKTELFRKKRNLYFKNMDKEFQDEYGRKDIDIGDAFEPSYTTLEYGKKKKGTKKLASTKKKKSEDRKPDPTQPETDADFDEDPNGI